MRSRSSGRVAAAAAVAALLAVVAGALTGCSGGSPAPGPTSPAATVAPTPSPIATPEPTPTPTPTPTWPPVVDRPTPPPEMSRDDEVGAVAAAEYFLTELYPYTVTSQDAAEWSTMSDADCVFCASTLGRVEDLRNVQAFTLLAPIRVASRSLEVVGPAAFGVFLDIETGPDQTFSGTGELLRTDAAASGRAQIALSRQNERWVVLGVELDKDNPASS